MEHSKGNWKRNNTTVITDNGEGFEMADGHDDLDYYGGYLICESILKKADADFGTRVIGIFDNSDIMQVLRTIDPEKWETKKRHYGLRIGDKVTVDRTVYNNNQFEVVEFDPLDNNSVMLSTYLIHDGVKDETPTVLTYPAEWCKKVEAQ